MNIFIASCPRSGSSMLTKLISSSGNKLFNFPNSFNQKGSIFNQDGYFEDIKLTLLNDMLIKNIYGYKYSFLFPPSKFKIHLKKNFDFYKSKNSKIIFPKNYIKKLNFYTGHNWDIWGITRMLKKKKWYNCYKKFQVNNSQKIAKSIQEFNKIINNSEKPMIFKDSRMVFTLHKYNIERLKVILLYRRSKHKHILSLRNHYGQNLFSKNYILKDKIVSNHFNLKVKGETFYNFKKKYNFFFNEIKKNHQFIEVYYEDIIKKKNKTLNKIQNFIGNSIKKELIKNL